MTSVSSGPSFRRDTTPPGASRCFRVALVVGGRGFGGAQVYARSLVAHAPPHVRCDVVTTGEHAPHLRDAVERHGGRTVVLSPERFDATGVGRALRELAPDVVHVNLVDATSMTDLVRAAANVAPSIATLHLATDAHAADDEARDALSRLAHLAAVSRPMAVCARHQLGLPAARVTHVLNGVDPLPRVARPRRAVPVIGVLARLTRQKGVDVLIDAVRILHSDGVPLVLAVAGEGREQQALVAQANGLPVHFTGFEPRPRAFLERIDVFCLASRDEGLPLALLEALSTGLPAVASDVGDVRAALQTCVDVVPPNDAAALADALRPLVADAGERARRGARAAHLVRRDLTASRMVRQTWEAFERAVATSSLARRWDAGAAEERV